MTDIQQTNYRFDLDRLTAHHEVKAVILDPHKHSPLVVRNKIDDEPLAAMMEAALKGLRLASAGTVPGSLDGSPLRLGELGIDCRLLFRRHTIVAQSFGEEIVAVAVETGDPFHKSLRRLMRRCAKGSKTRRGSSRDASELDQTDDPAVVRALTEALCDELERSGVEYEQPPARIIEAQPPKPAADDGGEP